MRPALGFRLSLVVVLVGLLGGRIGLLSGDAMAAPYAGTCADATPVPIATPASAEPAPPWGIQDVTTPELTADQFKQALPCAFSRYQLVDLSSLLGTLQVYPFAIESENFRYYVGPKVEDIPFASINVSTLPPDLTPVAAIVQVRALMSTELYFAPEAEDTAADAAVPYLLLQQDGGHGVGPVWALVWGARGGNQLFTVSTLKREDLAPLVQLIVANLERLSGAPATPDSR